MVKIIMLEVYQGTPFNFLLPDFGSAIDIIARDTGSFNAASNVDLSNNRITATGHTLSDGDLVTYTTNGGTAVRGLTGGSQYYVRNISGDSFQLSTTLRIEVLLIYYLNKVLLMQLKIIFLVIEFICPIIFL